MEKEMIYAVFGIVLIVTISSVVIIVSLDQNQKPSPVPIVPTIPPDLKQTSKPSDEWDELPVSFIDSNSNIPEVLVTQKWTNADALQACSMLLENSVIQETVDEADIKWCTEFMNSLK